MQRVDLNLDVSPAAGLGEPASLAVTVHLPDPAAGASPPVVCFTKPGAGFARGYFTIDLPGPGCGAQAEWHARRGWIFVSVDHLGVGDSSAHDLRCTDYATLAAAADAAEREVLARLGAGTLVDGFPALAGALVLGLGQSMGGCLTVFQQARHRTYDGIAVLGFGVADQTVPVRPGDDPFVMPWIPRDALDVVLNEPHLAATGAQDHRAKSTWSWFYDDVDVAAAHPTGDGPVPAWQSLTVPGVVRSIMTPGVVAPEAAAIDVPVLVAFGERDVCGDPKGEPRAYRSATSIDLFICPRMAHMHNFAGTRELLWRRIDTWARWVAAQRIPEAA